MDDIVYNEVTEESYQKFQWTGQRSLSISKVLLEIPPEKINQCWDTLLHLKLEQSTSIKNLKTFLRTCPNLKTITFLDALVDEYRRFPEDKPIEHNNLLGITIKSTTTIGKKEHWLVDFFFWRLSSSSLQSFRVQKIYTGLSDMKREETTAYMEKYGQILEWDIVTQFILKNRSTLREIEYGGPGLYTGESSSGNNKGRNSNKKSHSASREEAEEELFEIGLSSLVFSLDANGIESLLRTQSHLRELKCSHIFKMGILGQYLDVPNLMFNIVSCIEINAETLTDITLYPIMIVDVSRQTLIDQNVLGMFSINCEVFNQCRSLRALRLGLHAYRQETDLAQPGMATLMGTRLLGLHRIPAHVQELYLPVEEYSHDELESLAFNFPQFTKLQSFYFGTSQLNPINSFLIRVSWIQSLLYLPDIQRIEFHNGKLEDPDATRKLIEMNPNGNMVRMKQNFPRFTFEITSRKSSRIIKKK